MKNKKDFINPLCQHCDKSCDTLQDNHIGGFVSLCCGVGFYYEDINGNELTENDDVRHVPEWNE